MALNTILTAELTLPGRDNHLLHMTSTPDSRKKGTVLVSIEQDGQDPMKPFTLSCRTGDEQFFAAYRLLVETGLLPGPAITKGASWSALTDDQQEIVRDLYAVFSALMNA